MVKPEAVEKFARGRGDVEARIIEAVGQVGPRNIAEISRRTKVHPETVRYKFRKRFSRLGLRFHAEVDYQKLGLSMSWGTFQFAPLHYRKAPALFRLLNKKGYLNYYGKVVPSGHYVARFGVPDGMQQEHESLFGWLKREGILTDYSVQEAAVSRHLTMSPDYFDFRSGRWQIPWNQLGGAPARPLPAGQKVLNHLEDEYDLLILKELQRDSMQHITAVARNLKINDRTLEYHYRAHVIAMKLVSSYFVRWTQDTSKTLAHSVALARLTFHPADATGLKRVQAAVSKIPFLWEEDLLRDGTYVASLYVPLADMMPLLGYLNDELGELGSSVEMETVKTNEASSFTIPYEMWQRGAWRLDLKGIKEAVRKELRSSIEK